MINLATANARLLACDSYSRTEKLWLAMVELPDPADRVRLFLKWWWACDAPWPWQSAMASLMRDAVLQVDLAEHLDDEARKFFDALPPIAVVYRGCDAGRERGLSWTTDFGAAEEFASGRRRTHQRPTLVRAEIPKKHIFGVMIERDEAGIVLDPRRLRGLTKIAGVRARGLTGRAGGHSISPDTAGAVYAPDRRAIGEPA